MPSTAPRNPYSDSQVVHSETQVRGPDEFRAGQLYKLHSSDRRAKPTFLRVVQPRDPLNPGLLEADVLMIQGDWKRTRYFHSDLGLAPYDTRSTIAPHMFGKWNATNYVEPAKE